MRLPSIAKTMTLTYNDHESVHEPADEWISNHAEWCDWKDEDSKQRAVLTNSIWTIQVYPFGAGSFYCFAAPTLDEVLELANAEDAKCQKMATRRAMGLS